MLDGCLRRESSAPLSVTDALYANQATTTASDTLAHFIVLPFFLNMIILVYITDMQSHGHIITLGLSFNFAVFCVV